MADQIPEDDLDLDDLLYWGEFCCWMALVQAPIIYWLQGPSVSTDQFVVRTALVVIAAAGGIGLRARALILRRRARLRTQVVPAGAPGDHSPPGRPARGDSAPA